MTPQDLAKSGTEHGEQSALFLWANLNVAKYPMLRWMHAIPNGGSRGDNAKSRMIRGAQMKAEGVKQGVADVFLPCPINGWHGLYIEMKKPDQRPKREGSKGGLSDDQILFKEHCNLHGYGWIVCYSWEEAARTIVQYLEQR